MVDGHVVLERWIFFIKPTHQRRGKDAIMAAHLVCTCDRSRSLFFFFAAQIDPGHVGGRVRDGKQMADV
jgi:hypothetical protein